MQQLFNLFGNITVDLNGFDQAMQDVQDGAQNIQGQMQNIGDSATASGTALTAGITLPLVGIGAAALSAATQTDEAFAQIKNATGSTVEMTEELVNSAKNLYKDGYGESLEEISQAIIQVQNNMHNLSEADLEHVTKSAMNLAKTFETDINYVTRAGNNMMEAFGVTAEEAFDAMAKGAQNGLNFTDEMFDNLAEYSGLWGHMGYSMEEMFGILERGSKEGVYNLDYVNDIMKEFQIRVKDGSKTTADSMAGMSAETQKVWEQFLAGQGTVSDVAAAVVGDLQGMEDQVAAGNLAVGLFGTKFEDLESKAVYAMLGTTDAMTGAQGAMEELNKTAEETFSQKWQGFLRTAQMALEPVGMILLDLATKYLPIVAEWIEKVANAFAALPEGTQTTIVVLGILLAVLGPLLVAFGAIASAVGSIVGLFGSFAGVLRGAAAVIPSIISGITGLGGGITSTLPAIASLGPALMRALTMLLRFVPGIGIVVTAISLLAPLFGQAGTDLMTGLGNGIMQGLEYVLEGIKFVGNAIISFFKFLFQIASPSKLFDQFGRWIMQGLANGIKALVGLVTGVFSGLFSSIRTIVSTGINAVQSIATKGFNAIASGAKTAGNAIKTSISGALNGALSTAKTVASKAMQAGSDIAGGIAKGISSGAKKVGSGISSLSKYALSQFKRDNKIKSPSRLYMDEAAWIPIAIAQSIGHGAVRVAKAMTGLVKNTAKAFTSEKKKAPLDLNVNPDVAYDVDTQGLNKVASGQLDDAKQHVTITSDVPTLNEDTVLQQVTSLQKTISTILSEAVAFEPLQIDAAMSDVDTSPIEKVNTLISTMNQQLNVEMQSISTRITDAFKQLFLSIEQEHSQLDAPELSTRVDIQAPEVAEAQQLSDKWQAFKQQVSAILNDYNTTLNIDVSPLITDGVASQEAVIAQLMGRLTDNLHNAMARVLSESDQTLQTLDPLQREMDVQMNLDATNVDSTLQALREKMMTFVSSAQSFLTLDMNGNNDRAIPLNVEAVMTKLSEFATAIMTNIQASNSMLPSFDGITANVVQAVPETNGVVTQLPKAPEITQEGDFILQGDVILKVQEISDVTPQMMQNQVANIFYAHAKQME